MTETMTKAAKARPNLALPVVKDGVSYAVVLFKGLNPLSHRCAMPAPEGLFLWRYSLRLKRKACLPGSTPSVIACGVPPSQRGLAGERSEPEGVIPQRRAFAESGAATAVFRYDLTCENGTPGRPQTLPVFKL